MRVLVFGGTGFLSGDVVSAALARAWDVTCVHRGLRGPGDPRAAHVLQDRDDGSPIPGGPWDAVIDCSAQRGAQVRHAVAELEGRSARYVLVSTCSVYRDAASRGNGEDAPVHDPVDTAPGDPSAYAGRKAACEAALTGRAGALIVRPGLLVGPRDPTERFTWWVRPPARGGEVLAPGTPDAAAQILDVRDLAEWLCTLAAGDRTGIVNAVGPPTTLGALLAALPRPEGTRLTWVPDGFLEDRGWQAWTSIPLWLTAPLWGFARAHAGRCRAWGLPVRPLSETVGDTARWAATTPPPEVPGPTPEAEAEVLAAWHGR